MTGQFLDVIEQTPGNHIKTFCENHKDDVAVAKEEIGHMRIFLVASAPPTKDQLNNKLWFIWGEDGIKNIKSFIQQEFKAQLTLAEWHSYLHKPHQVDCREHCGFLCRGSLVSFSGIKMDIR